MNEVLCVLFARQCLYVILSFNTALCTHFLLLLEQFPPVPGASVSGCRGCSRLQLGASGSCGSDFGSSAGTLLVRKRIKVTGEEITSGLYSTFGK